MTNRVNFNPNIAVDTDHLAVSGALAYFYDTGTTNAQTVYSDSALSVAHPQPLVADSSGMFADVFSNDTTDLKIVVKTAAGATLYTIDPAVVQSGASGASSVTFSPTSRISATDVQAAIEEVDADVAQLEKDVSTYYDTAGSGNAYTVAVSGVTGYASGDIYNIRADRDCTGAVTLNIQGAGAKDWQHYDQAGAIVAYGTGEIVDGTEYTVLYDGTRFLTVNVRPHQVATSELQTGTATNPGTVSAAGIKAAIDTHSTVLQVGRTQSATRSTTATAMPFDTSIPQITEGGEFLSLAFTPADANSTLIIEVVAYVGLSGAGADAFVGALFVDSTADALAAAAGDSHADGGPFLLNIRYSVASGTTSARTYRFRAGRHDATTLEFNGNGGAAMLGSTVYSSMTITEYQ